MNKKKHNKLFTATKIHLKKEGKLAPALIVEDRSDNFAALPFIFRSSDEKFIVMEAAGRTAKEANARIKSITFVSESWISEINKKDAHWLDPASVIPSEDPNRKEALVMVCSELDDDNKENIIVTIQHFDRKENGKIKWGKKITNNSKDMEKIDSNLLKYFWKGYLT